MCHSLPALLPPTQRSPDCYPCPQALLERAERLGVEPGVVAFTVLLSQLQLEGRDGQVGTPP